MMMARLWAHPAAGLGGVRAQQACPRSARPAVVSGHAAAQRLQGRKAASHSVQQAPFMRSTTMPPVKSFVDQMFTRYGAQTSMPPVKSSLATAAGEGDLYSASGFQGKSTGLVKMMDEMYTRFGAQTKLQLPKVVVCGSQSAGKSSVMERICNVQLPRAAGTCTRCPSEVRMSYADAPWSCVVTLRREYSATGQKLNAPITSLVQVLKDGEQDLLAHIIRQAQAELLLDSSTDATDDSSGSAGVGQQLQFSRNVVVLDIKGREQVNLTLIDLPGLIQSSSDMDQAGGESSVDLIKSMVEDYIKSERTIIVATITMKDDMANQMIVDMARAADPEGHRTIKVFTKPDTIEEGTHDVWLSTVQEAHYLGLGCFVVMSPAEKDVQANIPLAAAAAAEERFFASQPPWNDSQNSFLQPSLGISRLRSQLSCVLVSLIERNLPAIEAEVSQLLNKALTELQQLPAAPSPKSLPQLSLLMRTLCDRWRNIEEARGMDVTFAKRMQRLYGAFAKQLLAARPYFIISEADTTTPSTHGVSGESFWLAKPPAGRTAITLEDVRHLAEEGRTHELPGTVPYAVLEALISEHKGKWSALADKCLAAVVQEVEAETAALVKGVCGQYPAAAAGIMSVLTDLQAEVLATAQQRLFELTDIEATIFTQNDGYYLDSKAAFLRTLMVQLYVTMHGSELDTNKGIVAMNALREAGIDGVAFQQLYRLSRGAQANEHLLELVASTFAYLKVASKRVIDGVPMHIRHHLLKSYTQRMESNLQNILLEFSSDPDSELLRLYMQEDPKIAQLRSKLTADIRQLQVTLHEVKNW